MIRQPSGFLPSHTVSGVSASKSSISRGASSGRMKRMVTRRPWPSSTDSITRAERAIRGPWGVMEVVRPPPPRWARVDR
jgi:hypothetical protein